MIHGRRLSQWLIVQSLEGSEQIRVAGIDHEVPRGSIYLIPPGTLADLGSTRGNRPVWMHFDLGFDANRDDHPQLGNGDETHFNRWMQPGAQAVFGCDLPVVIPPPLDAPFRAALLGLVERWRGGRPVDCAAAAAQLGLLLLDLIAALAPSAAPSVDQRLARAESSARSQLGAGIGVDAMAASAGLGRSTFCAVYSRHRGEGPGAFLRRERLALAASLVARRSGTIAEIARQCGYADPTAFIRAYRHRYGATPGAMRA